MLYVREKVIYQNNLKCYADVDGFRLEGEADISFENQRMRITNTMSESMGQKANIVFWCDKYFPDNIEISWDFYPLSNKGLCVMFFSATGKNREDIFSPHLAKRTGEYQMYHSSDINTLHISYFRRMYESERAFQVANLRKSCGFNLVAQGADPIPYPPDARPPYHMKIVKYRKLVEYYINDLLIFSYLDDGITYGDILTGGKVGFRQMSPMIAEYANFNVYGIHQD